jgi:hypothetical protein
MIDCAVTTIARDGRRPLICKALARLRANKQTNKIRSRLWERFRDEKRD